MLWLLIKGAKPQPMDAAASSSVVTTLALGVT